MPSRKHKGLIVFILCAFAFAKAQSTFNLNYTSGIKSSAFGVEQVSSNKYFVTSVFVDSAFGQQGLDLKMLDIDGGVTARKRYLFLNREFLTYLNNKFQHNISGSTMLISGGSYTGTMSTVIYSSVNKSTLDTNWVRYYFDGLYDYYLNSTFRTKPNEFWLFGNKFNNSGYSLRPYALKIDSSGNVLAVKEFTSFVNYDVRASYYDPIANLIYIGGRNVNIPQTPISFLACMDTLGNVIWNQQNYGHVAFTQIEVKNNYLVAVGSVYAGDFAPPSTLNPTYKLNILKVNASNGSIIWQKPYGSKRATNYLTSFVINSDESIVSSGCFFPPTTQVAGITDGIILKVNSAGDSLWSQSYSNFNGSVQEAFYDIKKTQDDGFIMCGVPFYAGDPTSQNWVVKTDSLGIAPGKSTGIKNHISKIAEINIFPNPANEQVTIKHKDDCSLFKKYQIYNHLGQLIKEEELNDLTCEFTINIADIQSGYYFLKVYTYAAAYYKELVIKH